MTFYTSLSGLQASQIDMSTISNNLANVSTDGFKKSSTQFADVMASNIASDPRNMVGSGVVVSGNEQEFTEGNLVTTGSSLDLAISGDGFFTVKTDGANPSTDYTRNGSFLVDANRYIVDGQGSFLQAYPVDADGNATATGADGLKSVQLPEASGSPVATSDVSLDVNLGTSATPPSSTTFDPTDATSYNDSTATTVYDSRGDAHTLTNYYVKNASADGTAGSSWSVYSYLDDQPLTASGASGPTTVSFDATGSMTSPTSAVSFDPQTPTGATAPMTLSLDLAGTSSTSTTFAVASKSQNGKASGQLSGVTIDDSGLITASYSNGDSLKLGRVALANFTDPTGLKQMGDSYWTATGVSGQASLGAADENGYGSLMSGTLEGSNVDITEELVNLIAAQRNFQANAKALDTENQVSQTIFQMQS